MVAVWGCFVEEVLLAGALEAWMRSQRSGKGIHSGLVLCSEKGLKCDCIYLSVKVLSPFFKMRNLRLRKFEQTVKIIQRGSDRGGIQKSPELESRVGGCAFQGRNEGRGFLDMWRERDQCEKSTELSTVGV